MIRKTTLDNGLRVITEQIPAVHSVAIGAWVAAGSRHEEADQAGISHFIEHMLFKGTERHTALSIAREIDAVGGCINAYSTPEHCCYFVKVLSEAVPVAMALLADVMQHSRFDLDEMEKERRVILNEITQVDDLPDELVHELFSDLLMKGHPLARPVGGSVETVSSLDRSDLLDYYRRRYCCSNLVVTAAGDLDHQQVVDLVANAFADLPSGEPVPTGTPPEYRHNLAVQLKSLEQTHFCLGTRGVAQNSPDRYAFHLLNTVLGGGMSSRLFQSVREQHGLAYAVFSYAQCHSDAGALVVYAATAPGDVSAAIRLVMTELRSLATIPLSADALETARNQLKGNLMLMLEGTENRMTRLAQNELYLQHVTPVVEVLQSIEAVSREDLLRLGGDLLDDASLCLQILGPEPPEDFSFLDLTLGR